MSSEVPIWLIAIVITVLMFGAAELGYRVGRRTTACDSAVSAVKASILALVGLMLAFSYSIAAGHYDRRVQTVIGEAKALKTCWLRADLADEPARSQIRETVRSIVATRLSMVTQRADGPALAQAEAQLASSKLTLWSIAVAQVQDSDEPEKHVLLTQSVNEVMDRAGERVAAFADRVPRPVMYLLVAIILTAGFLIGLSSGQDNHRVPALWAMMIGLLVTVLTMIFDLDIPGRGLISDRFQPLEQVRDVIDAGGLEESVAQASAVAASPR